MTKPAKRQPGGTYEVGYAKPPAATRFKPGQSGNPKGRPKNKPDMLADLHAVLKEKVALLRDGVPISVTVRVALLMKLKELALAGDARAQKRFADLIALAPDPVAASPLSLEEIMAKAARLAGLRGADPS